MIKPIHLLLIIFSSVCYSQDVERSSFNELSLKWSDIAIAPALKIYHFDLYNNVDPHTSINIQWQGDWVLDRKFWMGFEISYPNVVFDSDDLNHGVLVLEGWFGALFTPISSMEFLKVGGGVSGQFAELISQDKDHTGSHLLETGESEFGFVYGVQFDFNSTPLSIQYLQKVHFTNPNPTVSSHFSLLYFWRPW
jgi:hypothetical protein